MSHLLTFHNETRGTVLGTRICRTAHVVDRQVGLLGRSGLEVGEGLWIDPCRGIHTLGMRFSFDALFLDGELNVVGLLEGFRPFRLGPVLLSTRSVLELREGTIDASETRVGDRLGHQPG